MLQSRIRPCRLAVFAFGVAIINCALFCIPANAAMIEAGAISTVASGGIAPGSSADYYFFGGESFAFPQGRQPTNLTDFTLTDGPLSDYGGNAGFSTLQAPGGSAVFTTGTDYIHARGTANLATFKLNGGSNESFALYVLFGNTDGAGTDTSISISSNGGTDLIVPVIESGLRGINDFLEFDVSGANAGDTFSIFGTSDSNQSDIGGVTFSALTSVPEPASLSLFGLALAGLTLIRRKLNKASV